MKNLILIILFLVNSISNSYSQSLNLDMELNYFQQSLPDNWFDWSQGYEARIDSITKFQGKYSIRIDAPLIRAKDEFGSTAYVIKAPKIGKIIELTAYMKIKQVKNGIAGLLLRIDGKDSILLFENMESKKIKGTSEWKKYSIKHVYPQGSKKIYIGAILSGEGSVWIDNFSILIDGKPVSEINSFAANLDKEFEKSSKIHDTIISEECVENVELLCKVWGLIKYYHPRVTSGNYNWDFELFRILPKILNAENKLKRNEILLDWVSSIGEFEISNVSNDVENYKLTADFSWINTNLLGNDLYQKLLVLQNSVKDEDQYYVELDPAIGFAVFKNESSYSNMESPDAGYRLLALFRYWNMIQYFYPNRHLIDGKWDNVLKDNIPIFLKSNDSLEYRLNLLKLIGRITDSHANIYEEPILENFYGLNAPPFEINLINKRAVIKRFIDTIDCQSLGISLGDIIFSINGIPIDSVIRSKISLCPSSNESSLYRDLAGKLLRTNENFMELGIIRNESRYVKKVSCKPIQNYKYYYAYNVKDTCFKLFENNIAYLNVAYLKNIHIDELMTITSNKRGLIIDLREYPLEFIVYNLGYHLLPSQIPFAKFSTPDLSMPGRFIFSNEIYIGDSNSNYFKGKVIVLINENTQSQGEFTAMAYRNLPNVTFLGNNTAGADGNVTAIYLPGGIYTLISGIGVYYPNGSETQRIGITPDIYIFPTINGIKNSEDELLLKAIDLINQY